MAKEKKERKKSTFWKDFKAFISRGNIVDLAVAVVVGAAFTAIVNSVVNDIIKPLISLLVGGEFSELVVVLRPEEVDAAGEVIAEAITLNYGNLIMAILTFLIDAFVIFAALRIIRNAQNKLKEGGEKLKLKFTKSAGGETEEASVAVAEETPVSAATAEVSAEPAEPAKPSVEELLAEIRDLLRERKEADAAAKEKEEDKN